MRLIHAGAGKNAADVLLSIDAMELALRDGVEGFVIASSDGDFAHIANRLREGGRAVVGVGEGKTPPCFRAACTVFEAINVDPPDQPVKELDLNIRTMIAQHSTKAQGMKLAELALEMHKNHGVRISTLPEKTWRGYLLKRPALYEVDPKGPEAKVRFRPAAFAN